MMNDIREKVARAIYPDAWDFTRRFTAGNPKLVHENMQRRALEDSAVAITTFLEAAAEQGWHMRPDEITEEMDTAGSGWCWHEAPPKCWRDMTKAAPKFEWDKDNGS